MTRAPLVLAALAVAAGILAGMERLVPTWDGPLSLWAWAGAALAGLLALRPAPAMDGGRAGGRGPALLWALFVVAGFLMGAGARVEADRACTGWLPDRTFGLTGRLESAAGERLRLRVDSVRMGAAALRCGAVVPARWAGATPEPGERVAGEGQWLRFPGSAGAGPGGLLLLDRLEARPVEADGGAVPRVRHLAASRLEALYGPRAPLASSLLLARRDGLDRELRDRFARAGLSHLLAISGLHVGLVAGVLLLVAGAFRLRRSHASAAAGAGTVLYVAFLGAPASAARAALQVVLVLAGRGLQRPARAESMVATAALILMAAQPASLLAPGFQLSFAGVAGLLAIRPPILSRLRRLADWRPLGRPAGKWLADSLSASVAATVATAPIVAWHFGRIALVGILANVVAVPLMGVLVPTLGLSLAVGAVWEAGGRFLAGGGGLLLDALERVAAAAAAAPGGSVPVRPGDAARLTLAVVAGIGLTRRSGRVRPALRWLAAAGAAGALLLIAPIRPAGDAVEVHMIDVGQGDAIAVRSPAGRWILVDAGVAGPRFDAGARRVVPYLERRGVRRLEALVLTHPHLDHFGGADAVVQALRPRWIADPGMAVGTPQYLHLLRSVRGRARPWIGAGGGLELELDGMVVEFLHPARPGRVAVADPNDISLVVRIEYGEFSALLTGDAPAAVEQWLVERHGARLEAEVLKVGHHGSATSTTRALLEATDARIALISAGRGNRFGHPHAVVLRRLEDRGVRVLRTDRHGSVVVRGDAAGGITTRAERGDGS